jgi:hypothetical protein
MSCYEDNADVIPTAIVFAAVSLGLLLGVDADWASALGHLMIAVWIAARASESQPS